MLIEAQNRIGGRAYTDHHTFGVPYDMGCHWLNYGNLNPWIDYGKTNGFAIDRVPEEYRLFVGKMKATPEEYTAYEVTYDQVTEEIGRIAEKKNYPEC